MHRLYVTRMNQQSEGFRLPLSYGARCENEKLLKDLGGLLKNSTLSDVVAGVDDGQVFHLHKVILAIRSPVLAAMFASSFEEAKTGRFKVPDISAESFKVALDFIYTGKLPFSSSPFKSVSCASIAHRGMALELFQFADKYEMESLKTNCEQHIMHNLTIESVIDIFIFADMHSADQLKKRCLKYICENQRAVKCHKSWAHLKSRPELILELYDKLLVAVMECSCNRYNNVLVQRRDHEFNCPLRSYDL